MLRMLLLVLTLSTFLISSSNFTVRLGVYKNDQRLHKALAKYPPALKQTIRTYKKRKLTYVHTVPTDNKNVLKRLLPEYRKVFPDAYISPAK